MTYANRLGLWCLAAALAFPALSTAAFVYFDPRDPANAPATLSGTGLYTNMNDKSTLDTAAKYFEINSALWSDGSLKKRWIILRPGRSIPWTDSVDFFSYPDSTVFVKTFLQVRGPGDTAYWETRLLMQWADTAAYAQNWYGFSYRWNQAQNEATLVDVNAGFDTAFSYVDAQGRTTYKKWKFPSQGGCIQCHKMYSGGPDSSGVALLSRAVLGFYPMQLKRPTASLAGNQVLDLFNQGVFSGTRPTSLQLAERFAGIHDYLDPSYTPAERRWALDNMARSYLAAQCGGCHGVRAERGAGSGARIPPNFDYYDLQAHNTPWDSIPSGYFDTTAYTDSLWMPGGRPKYLWLVNASGLGSNPYWSMALPAPDAVSGYEIYWDSTQTGYVALSNILSKQINRTMPAVDSARMYQSLKPAADGGDTVAINRLTWIFSAPWGSQAWLNNLASHGFNLDSVMAGWQGNSMYQTDGDQMPPLATYIPDTAALKILAEWVAGYGLTKTDPGPGRRPLGIARPAARRGYALMNPVIRGRTLYVPQGWTGKARMLDIRGRAYPLQALGGGKYALPASVRAGVYFFRVGSNYFKASML